MNERTRKLLVFSVALIVVVWGYLNLFGPHKKSSSPATPTSTALSAPSQVKVKEARAGSDNTDRLIITDQIAESYESAVWGKDPFYHSFPDRKSRVVQQQKIRLKLLGILYREVAPQALINNRVVSIGDDVSGYRVIKITPDYVTVTNQTETIKLRVTKESS